MKALLKRDFYQLSKNFLFALGIIVLSQIRVIISIFNGYADIESLVFFTIVVGMLFGSAGYASYTNDLDSRFTEYVLSMPISLKDYGTEKILLSIIPSTFIISIIMFVFKLNVKTQLNVFLLWAILLLFSLIIGIGALVLLIKFGKNSKVARNILMVVFMIALLSFFAGFFAAKKISLFLNYYVLGILMIAFVLIIILYKKMWQKEMEALRWRQQYIESTSVLDKIKV